MERPVMVVRRLFVASLTLALLAFPTIAAPASAAGPTCMGVPATIVGDGDANLIRGTDGRDVIVAGGGNDKILGRGGNDLICAGSGNDIIIGGEGRDRIFGQWGKDRLKGGPGFDTLDGGPGADACYVNGDGGRETACEGADLRVTVTGPASVVSGALFELDVKVKNVGAKPAADVVLELEWSGTNVSCEQDPEAVELGKIKPGWWKSRSRELLCGVGSGEPNEMRLDASAATTSPESHLANNVDAAVTTILRTEP